VLHVGGLRPSACYYFRIPERDNPEPVSVSRDFTFKIVSEGADEKTLNRAARYVLDVALRVRALAILLLPLRTVANCPQKCENRTSLAFVAHDIGGSVVKQALVIASQEEEYSRVLEDTHLLIFSGVPNRPSPQSGWFSPLLSIVDSCFFGLKGPWIPKVLDRLATEHDAIAKNFEVLASRFRIVSFYEADELVVTNRATLSKHCATLGVAHEDAIAIADQGQLEYWKAPAYLEMSKIIDTCLLSHGKDLTDFVRLLSFDDPPQSSDTFFHPTHIHVARHLLSLPEAKPWLTSTEGEINILRLVTRDILDEERLFDSLVTAVRLSKSHYHPSILRIARHHQPVPKTEAGILASLVKQILRQQPQLYPTVESLFSLVHDAALSRNATWKKRVFWRCVETLLLSPRDVDTFLFVALNDNFDDFGIFPRILSTAAKTSIPLRIAVAISSLDRYPKELSTPSPLDLDVLSDIFTTARNQDSTTQFPGVLSFIPLRDPSDDSVETTLFARALESEGAWLPVAVLWATSAERPLSVAELNILITLEIGSNTVAQSHESPLERDRASLLPQLLPSMFEIVDGTLRVGHVRALEHEAKTVFEARLGTTVDAHFADTCLVYLLDFLRQGPAIEAVVGQFNKQSDEDKDEVGVGGDRPERSQVRAMREAATSLAMYAAQHWTTHWRRDGEGSKLENYQGHKDFLTGGGTVLEGWIRLLVESSDILADEYVNEVDKVMHLLGSESLPNNQVLEYVSYAYSCPSSTPIFDRLLVLAAELADEQFIKGLCEVASKAEEPFTAEEVARAIAAAPLSLIDSLSQLPLRDGAILNKSDIYLRAMQLANTPVAGAILQDLRSQTSFSDADHADLFVHALCIAYEYGDPDTATISQIISHDTRSELLTTALHISIAVCNTDAALNLLDLGVPIEAYARTGDTPLLLAAQHGFTSLVRTLVTKREADVNAKNVLSRTALHFAAQNGFEEIVRILVGAEGGNTSVIARDNAGAPPIVVAVRSGHEAVATFLIKTRLEDPEVGLSEVTWSEEEDKGMEYIGEEVHLDEDAGGQEAEERELTSDVEMEVDGSKTEQFEVELPRRVLNLRVAILYEAARRGFIEIVEMLVGEVTEEDILSDMDLAFTTPLHAAAKGGFTDIARLLCKKYPALLNAAKSDIMLTPLHLACYYGQKAVVDELLKHAPDFSLLSSSSRTPFEAACKVGALDVITSLLPALPPPADTENTNIRDRGLNGAARWANKEVVEFLLDHGGSPNAVDQYANAALSQAAWNRDCRLMESLLLRRCTLDPKDDDGSTPLFDATRRDANDCVRLLANAGADLDCETRLGCTPLDEAVYRKNPVLVRLLLDRGAKMELCPFRKDHYDSLLTFALRSSSEEVVRVLVEFYAKGRGEEGITPATALGLVLDQKPDVMPALLESWPQTKEHLSEEAATNFHSIASKGSVETLKAALEVVDKDAINSPSGTSGTPLHAAICGGEDVEDKVNVLLDHDADPSIIGGRHRTTLNAAAHFHLQSVAKLLLERLPKSTNRRWFMNFAGVEGTPIQAAVKGLRNANSAEAVVELLEFLRSEEAPLTYSGLYGENLLHAAARATEWHREEAVDAVKWLLKNGVDPDESDITGRRPMHLAINNGNIDLVKLLLTKNTTLQTLDHQRMNGLHHATLSKRSTMTNELVDLYREDDQQKDISSFIEAQDVDAWTPLHWACRQAELDIVSYLINDCKANAKAKTKGGWTPWHVAMYHGNTNDDYLKLLPEPPLHKRSEVLPGAPNDSAWCDICYATIFGDRYQCLSQDCCDPDTRPETVFDMCWKCYTNHSDGIALHVAGHDFQKVDA
ncbi:MAG: hypothetical protein Q9172_001671, partial [Xanthocarpia lactea]